MVIVRFQGGLGNQLFQYMLYRKYQILGINAKADILYYFNTPQGDTARQFELGNFKDIKLDYATQEEVNRFKITKESSLLDKICCKIWNKTYYDREPYNFHKEIFKQKNLYLNGFWQDYNYFKDIFVEVKNELDFKQSLKKENIEIEKKIRNKQAVSVHVRRGDYTNRNNYERYGRVCSIQYYYDAMKRIEKNVSNPYYFFFSDEPEWVLDNFKLDNMEVVTCNQKDEQYYDMHLMSCCKHNIIANSTYSWWAAFLNSNTNKIVISPAYTEYKKIIPVDKRISNWKYLS